MQSDNSAAVFILWVIGAVVALSLMQWLDLPASISVFIYTVLTIFGLMAVAALWDLLDTWFMTHRLTRLARWALETNPDRINAGRRLVQRMLKRNASLPRHQGFLAALSQQGPLQTELLRLACHRISTSDTQYRNVFDQQLEYFADQDLPQLLKWLRKCRPVNYTGDTTPDSVLYRRIVERASPNTRVLMLETLLLSAPLQPDAEWTELFRIIKTELMGMAENQLNSYLREKWNKYIPLL